MEKFFLYRFYMKPLILLSILTLLFTKDVRASVVKKDLGLDSSGEVTGINAITRKMEDVLKWLYSFPFYINTKNDDSYINKAKGNSKSDYHDKPAERENFYKRWNDMVPYPELVSNYDHAFRNLVDVDFRDEENGEDSKNVGEQTDNSDKLEIEKLQNRLHKLTANKKRKMFNSKATNNNLLTEYNSNLRFKNGFKNHRGNNNNNYNNNYNGNDYNNNNNNINNNNYNNFMSENRNSLEKETTDLDYLNRWLGLKTNQNNMNNKNNKLLIDNYSEDIIPSKFENNLNKSNNRNQGSNQIDSSTVKNMNEKTKEINQGASLKDAIFYLANLGQQLKEDTLKTPFGHN